jgi:CheY-like chemotaxis protein
MLSKKILIADDTELVLKLEEILLKRAGCEIIKAKTGPEAIEKFELEKPFLALLDLVMPGMEGDRVCQYVKSKQDIKDCFVVIVTSHGEPETKLRCEKAGCDKFMTKPIDSRELVAIVTKLLKQFDTK